MFKEVVLVWFLWVLFRGRV